MSSVLLAELSFPPAPKELDFRLIQSQQATDDKMLSDFLSP